MTTTMQVAKERRLDWLLDEALGGRRAGTTRTQWPARATPWLAAAMALLAIGVALGVAWLRADERRHEAQDPVEAIPWHECHGADELDKVPADVTALRCFDFGDDACARLARFAKLEHLDLSGMDVNDEGYAVSLKITDSGVRALAPLTALRSLSLAGCAHLRGRELRVLEAMPRLESLDLEHSGIEAPAVWRLARLPSLRALSLSYCSNFHGSALVRLASLPGLHTLELRGCVTLAAKDAMALANLQQLRHLDLRDCQGRFRGQTLQVDEPSDPTDGGQAAFVDTDDDGLPDNRVLPPVQDGIGITDEVVAALSALPLVTMLLGGSQSLTDAIGSSLAKMTTLRALDLSNLPKTTGALLAKVPVDLESLALDDNAQFDRTAFAKLPKLPRLRELGLSAIVSLDDEALWDLFARQGASLHTLRLGGAAPVGKAAAPAAPARPNLSAKVVAALIRTQPELRNLDASYAAWIDGAVVEALAALPQLTELNLTNTSAFENAMLAPLAKCNSLRTLNLTWCRQLDRAALAALAGTRLQTLNLYGTRVDAEAILELAAQHFRGCLITLPNGVRHRAP